MRTQRDQVATTVGVAAAAVALTSLGLPWFSATTKLSPTDVPVTGETTGWHFMTTTDIVIAILAVMAIVVLLIKPEAPVRGGSRVDGLRDRGHHRLLDAEPARVRRRTVPAPRDERNLGRVGSLDLPAGRSGAGHRCSSGDARTGERWKTCVT